jgi:tetratricopeptide (TPR) repeat protein
MDQVVTARLDQAFSRAEELLAQGDANRALGLVSGFDEADLLYVDDMRRNVFADLFVRLRTIVESEKRLVARVDSSKAKGVITPQEVMTILVETVDYLKLNPQHEEIKKLQDELFARIDKAPGRYSDLLRDLPNDVISVFPLNLQSTTKAKACFGRGLTHFKNGVYDSAIADYSEAIQWNPEFAEAFNNRGVAHRNNGDYDSAITDYTEAIQLSSGYADAYRNRGFAHYKNDDTDLAIADYTEAIQLNPNSAEAYNNLGLANRKKGLTKSAISAYNQAIRLNPRYRAAYSNRGVVFAELGSELQAQRDRQKARALGNEP